MVDKLIIPIRAYIPTKTIEITRIHSRENRPHFDQVLPSLRYIRRCEDPLPVQHPVSGQDLEPARCVMCTHDGATRGMQRRVRLGER